MVFADNPFSPSILRGLAQSFKAQVQKFFLKSGFVFLSVRNPGHVFLVLFTPHERKPCLGGGKDARPASGGHYLDACEGPASCCAWTSSRRESQGIRPVAPQQAFLWSLCRPPPPVPPLPLPQRWAYKRTLTITVPFLKSAEVSFCSQRKISS